MRILLSILLALAVVTTAVSAPTSKGSDDASIDFAKSVAKKFIDAIDRKRPDVAEHFSYLNKLELPSGIIRRIPSLSEGVLKMTVDSREIFGKMLSRDLVQTSIVRDHSSLPDSKFVELRYELKFEKKDKVREFLKIKVEGEQKGKVVLYSGR